MKKCKTIQRRSDLLFCSDISLDERIKLADELIEETKESLKEIYEEAYPKLHEFYRLHLRSLELTRRKLIDALMERDVE